MINPNTYNSLFGLSMQQSWEDLVLWEWFLNRARAKSVLELGTGSAAFSCYLLSQCISRGMQFATIDRKKPDTFPLHQTLGVFSVFFELDLLSPGAKDTVASIVRGLRKPLVLFCDNGDKPHEVILYHDLLERGDYIGVHDFGVEIHDHNLDPIRDRIVEIVKPEEAIGNTRWYRIVKG